MAAKVEKQDAEAIGDEEVGDAFQPTLVFGAIRVPAVDQDRRAVPAHRKEPALQGQAVARSKGHVLIRRGGNLWRPADRMTLGVGEAIGHNIGDRQVANRGGDEGDQEKSAFH